MARTVGFFTDTTVCIGCKACEVACKEWNQLPGHEPLFRDSFDNTGKLDEQNWRHVQFHERGTPAGRDEHAATMIFLDGGMYWAQPDEYELLDLDTGQAARH